MFNWKKKIDDQEETEIKKQEQQKALDEAKKIAEKNKFKTFRCHICKIFATIPYSYYVGEESYAGYPISSGGVREVFDKPGDLWQCKKCNKWTCADDIYKGICRTCA